MKCPDESEPFAWQVHAQHTLEQYRYPGMDRDCERLVADLARFARTHLPERVKLEAIAA
jgi:hypothetical protein